MWRRDQGSGETAPQSTPRRCSSRQIARLMPENVHGDHGSDGVTQRIADDGGDGGDIAGTVEGGVMRVEAGAFIVDHHCPAALP